MSIKRFNAKRDANEPEIIDKFESLGASVESIDTPCDLIVGYGNISILVEVKTEKGVLTENQKDFIRDWKGQYCIVRTTEEAATVFRTLLNND